MGKTFLFPGQGSQGKGMGAGLFERHPELVTMADDIRGYSIRTLCLEDPDGQINKTQLTQPALYVVNALAYRDKVEQCDLVLAARPSTAPLLQASYRPITQLGADFQVPRGSMMWKGELLYRRGHGSPFAAFSLGGEYTLTLAAADLGLLLEWSRDYRDAGAPVSIYANALFGGLRWRLNNRHDTEILLGQQLDRANRMRFFSLELSHRLGDNWKLQVEGKRFTTRAATPYPLNVLRDENYLQAKLSYFF